MTSRNPPSSSDATPGTGTVLSDEIISISNSNSSDSDSASESLSSWGVNDSKFPSVVAAANNNCAGFPPTVEADAEDDVVAEVEDDDAVVVVVEVEDDDTDVEKDATEIVDEQTSSCSDHSSTDTTKHNNDDNNNRNNNNHNNNTLIQPSSKKEGTERKKPNSAQPIKENACNNGSENIHIIDAPIVVTPLNDTNNDNTNDDTNDDVNDDTKDKDNNDTSIQAPHDVPVPFVVGLQTRTIIDELKNIFVGVGDNNNNDQQQQLQDRQLIAVEYAQAEKMAAFADWGAYLRRYEDLQQVITKDDHQKARQHYLEYGFNEGRDCGPGTAEKIADTTADWGAYLRRYEDLQQVISKDDYQKARQHYLEYGFTENRDCGPGTAEKLAATTADWGAYLRRYEDLQKVIDKHDYQKARQHYLEYGCKEGRDCGPGIAEKLAASANWGEYLQRYEDLHKAFGDDHEKAQQHYLEYGYREGRTPFHGSGFVAVPSVESLAATADWAAYLRRNTDLQKGCGTDHKKAKAHFLEYGYQEKRYAGPDLLLPPPEARSIHVGSDFNTTPGNKQLLCSPKK